MLGVNNAKESIESKQFTIGYALIEISQIAKREKKSLMREN